MFLQLFRFMLQTCLRAGGAIEHCVQRKMDVRFKQKRGSFQCIKLLLLSLFLFFNQNEIIY